MRLFLISAFLLVSLGSPTLADKAKGFNLKGQNVTIQVGPYTTKGSVLLKLRPRNVRTDASETVWPGTPCTVEGASGNNTATTKGTCTASTGATYDCECTTINEFTCTGGLWAHKSSKIQNCKAINVTPENIPKILSPDELGQ